MLPSSLTSVSRQITALEQHFGTRLLLRTTRQLALTDEGRLLYERAKAIVNEVKEIEAALSRDRHQPSGRIRVSSPSLMGRLVIAPLLAEFLRRYPALSVDLLLVDRAVDMVEEDIHLAIRVGRLRDSQLVARKLADLRMIACASPDYLARRGGITVAEAARLIDPLSASPAARPEAGPIPMPASSRPGSRSPTSCSVKRLIAPTNSASRPPSSSSTACRGCSSLPATNWHLSRRLRNSPTTGGFAAPSATKRAAGCNGSIHRHR